MPRRLVELMDDEVVGAITVDEAARRAGISRRTMYSMVKEGTVPGAFRIGWSWRIDKEIFFAHIKNGVHSGSQSQGVVNCESGEVEAGVPGEAAGA